MKPLLQKVGEDSDVQNIEYKPNLYLIKGDLDYGREIDDNAISYNEETSDTEIGYKNISTYDKILTNRYITHNVKNYRDLKTYEYDKIEFIESEKEKVSQMLREFPNAPIMFFGSICVFGITLFSMSLYLTAFKDVVIMHPFFSFMGLLTSLGFSATVFSAYYYLKRRVNE